MCFHWWSIKEPNFLVISYTCHAKHHICKWISPVRAYWMACKVTMTSMLTLTPCPMDGNVIMPQVCEFHKHNRSLIVYGSHCVVTRDSTLFLLWPAIACQVPIPSSHKLETLTTCTLSFSKITFIKSVLETFGSIFSFSCRSYVAKDALQIHLYSWVWSKYSIIVPDF